MSLFGRARAKLPTYLYCTFPILYGERYLTLNMHQLLHLTDSVKTFAHYVFMFWSWTLQWFACQTVHSKCVVDKQTMCMFSYLQGVCIFSRKQCPGRVDWQFIFQDLYLNEKFHYCVHVMQWKTNLISHTHKWWWMNFMHNSHACHIE